MNYFETDTVNEVVRGLGYVAEFLDRARIDSYSWKCVVIHLDSSLQNAMVAAVVNSTQTNVLSNGNAVYNAIHESRPGPEERLQNFHKLLELVQSSQMERYSASKKLVLTGGQKKSIEDTHNRFRNDFTHFVPRTLIVELTGFPEMVRDCVDVVEFLMLNSGNVMYQDGQIEEIAKRLKEIRVLIPVLMSDEKLHNKFKSNAK